MKTSSLFGSRQLRDFVALVMCLVLAGCGFHLRGSPKLPFSSVYVAANEYSSFAAELKRYLESGNKAHVVNRAEQAEVTLEILGESSEKEILSLSTAGRVREFQLRYRLRYRLSDQSKREWISPTELLLRRDLTYSDTEVLAKESEEALLVRDMKNDALQLILRRLAKAKPPIAS